MSLSEVLAQAQSARCLQAIAERYRLTGEQAHQVANFVRPVVLRQIEACLTSSRDAVELLRMFAQPVFNQIEDNPSDIVEQDVRLSGDAVHRQLSRVDHDLWGTMDRIARDAGISHQTLRAMMPSLTLLILGALRRAATPVFLRFLLQHRPDDAGTDPFVFARDHADLLSQRRIRPASTLRWLDQVLSRSDDSLVSLRADPGDRFC